MSLQLVHSWIPWPKCCQVWISATYNIRYWRFVISEYLGHTWVCLTKPNKITGSICSFHECSVADPENSMRWWLFFKLSTKIFKVFLRRSYANRVILIIENSSLAWGVRYIIFWIKKSHRKTAISFLNKLIWTNNLIIKVLIRSLIVLNVIENKSRSFNKICVFLWDLGRMVTWSF